MKRGIMHRTEHHRSHRARILLGAGTLALVPLVAMPAGAFALDASSDATVPQAMKVAQGNSAQIETAGALAVDARTLSGTVNFPAEADAETRASLVIALRHDTDELDEHGDRISERIEYGLGDPDFDYDPQTGEWAVTGLDAVQYVSLEAMITATGQEYPTTVTLVFGPDLTDSDVSGYLIDANTGVTRIGFVHGDPEQSEPLEGHWDQVTAVTYTNVATGAEYQAKNDGSGGDPITNNLQSYVPVGTYTLSVALENGRVVYFDGTETGTEVEADAQQIEVTWLESQALLPPSTWWQLLDWINMDPIEDPEAPDKDTEDPGDKPDETDKPAKPVPSFTDVPKSHQFYDDISWLAAEGITTGIKQADGSVKFAPKTSVSREAMIAFLFRLADADGYQAPAKSPFTDVAPGDQFYKQIMWAYDNKVTTGMKQADGSLKFAPKARITREAMAAFVYRQYHDEFGDGAKRVSFTDIPADHQFAKEIRWMASNGITTGRKQADGSVKYAPKGQTSREATAAFLHRAEAK